ncbi:MAG TPA: cytochrome c-type biogenesis protein [bacterium]|nr:cytochrome c-type biogenesis protein [bacterium]
MSIAAFRRTALGIQGRSGEKRARRRDAAATFSCLRVRLGPAPSAQERSRGGPNDTDVHPVRPSRLRALGLLLFSAPLLLAASGLAAPSLEDQVNNIAQELMCPVCAGQTVAESNSTLANQMREQIRVRLRRGETREQILAYFVGQFGESVLAAPPRRGGYLVLWLAPVLAFGLGVFLMIRYLRGMTRPRPAPPS